MHWIPSKILRQLDDSNKVDLVDPGFLDDSDKGEIPGLGFFMIRIGMSVGNPKMLHSDPLYTAHL